MVPPGEPGKPVAAPKRALARRMPKAPAFTERMLWKLLRDRRLEALKFRRQVPIGPYVVDFVCLRHRLVVEADGPFHDPDRDAVRDRWLRAEGFRVLRFSNGQVQGQTEFVLGAIVEAAGVGR
ncbi:MAG TPA: endonuclease domain-containing protein [Caulobacteraceae bacterium]|nr:endonuclease domain-containing protein [Caulobacteraceae bacterium]